MNDRIDRTFAVTIGCVRLQRTETIKCRPDLTHSLSNVMPDSPLFMPLGAFILTLCMWSSPSSSSAAAAAAAAAAQPLIAWSIFHQCCCQRAH